MRTHSKRWIIAAFSLGLLSAAPVQAQGALVIFGGGGRLITLSSINQNGDNIGDSWVFGGGLGIQLNRVFAVRGMIGIAKSDFFGDDPELQNVSFRRTFVGADLQWGTPFENGITPYLFAGGGVVQVDPAGLDPEAFNSVAGRFGAGVNYLIDNAFAVVFIEAATLTWNFDGFGFGTQQYDLIVALGMAYALPL